MADHITGVPMWMLCAIGAASAACLWVMYLIYAEVDRG